MTHRHLLVVICLGVGCTNACPNGPSCESDWPSAALAIHQWSDDAVEATAREDASLVIVGDANEGSDWRTHATAQGLWLGMPDANVVKEVDPTNGTPYRTWSAIDGRFGSQLAHLSLYGQDFLVVSAPEWGLQKGLLAFFPDDGITTTYELPQALVQLTGQSPGDHFGETIAVCGDMTGDGHPEIAVSIPWIQHSPGTQDGAVPPLAGGLTLLLSEALASANGQLDWFTLGPTWWGVESGDSLGDAIQCDSDIDGDGWPDLIVGAPFAGADDKGKVYGISGVDLPPSGPILEARSFEITGTGANSWAGAAFVVVPTVDQETIALVVGEPGYNQGRGRAFLTTSTLINEAPLSPKYRYILRGSGDAGGAMHFGRSLTTGDVDGDAIHDLIIGAPDYRSSNRSDAGRAWIYLGKNQGSWGNETQAEVLSDGTILGTEAFQRVGRSLRIADTTGDGVDDILIPMRASSP